MPTCPSSQAPMLEYLYGLLEDAERQAMQDHLANCAACRAELARAKEQQQLLAAAARLEFADVRFTAPAPQEGAPVPAPAVLPMPKPAPKARRWRRLAAAAAVLLALGGLAAPGYWMERDYSRAEAVVAEKQGAVADAHKQMRDAAAEIQVLPRLEREKIDQVQNSVRARGLKVDVVGPATAVAGVRTTYEIQTRDFNDQLVAADVKVRLADAANQANEAAGDPIPVVKAEDGRCQVTLPADLAVKPDSRPVLVVSAKRDSGLGAQVSEQLDLAPPVYVTRLDTDKPMYLPGETVHFRSLTLDRFSLKPAEEDLRLTYELVTPTSGKRTLMQGANGLRDRAADEPGTPLDVLGPDNKPIRGVGASEFVLDPGLDGGEYTLVCREENNRFPEQRRKFLVNNYPKPQLNKQLDFNRSTYGPGDEVVALCKAVHVNGDPVRNQPVEATVLIDDKKYGPDGKEAAQPLRFRTDDQGAVAVHFKLPALIERGEASLGVKFLGAPVETIARPLPIVLKKLNVEFYPEGGDLAADLPNRVYFQVRTPLGKPADLKGRLFEDGQPLAVPVETLHDDQEPGVNQGMGRFEFTPKSGKKYELQIDSPVGISARIGLPDVKPDAVVLKVKDGVAEAGRPIVVEVHGKKERALMVGLYCRGRLLHSVELKKGETEAVLNPADGVGGVCRVTAFEETPAAADRRELNPVAERLIYRQPTQKLTVDLRPDRSSYVPGQRATLGVEARDEKGESVPAVVMLAVVDKSVLTLADEKTYRSMPTHFLLTSEVRRPEDLEYADFLLGPHPKAAASLDLLLGVQGWRRFAEQDPTKFRRNNIDKEEAERLLVLTGQSAPRTTDLAAEEIKKIQQDTDARIGQLREQYDRAGRQAEAALADPGYAAAAATRAAYDRLIEQARRIGAPLVGVVLMLGALVFLILGLRQAGRRAVPFYAAAAAAVALLVAAAPLYWTGETNAPPAPTADVQVAQLEPPTLDRLAEREMEEAEEGKDAPMAKWAKDDKDGAKPDVALGFGLGGRAGNAALPFAPAPPPAAMPALAPGAPPGADKPAMAMPMAGAKVPAAANGPGDFRFQGAANNGNMQGGPQAAPALEAKQEAFARAALDRDQNRKEVDALKEVDAAKDRMPEEKTKGLAKKADQNEAQRALWQNWDEKRQILREQAAADGKGAAMAGLSKRMVVRQYAYGRGANAADGAFNAPETRQDFADTIYWHPVLVLPKGQADVSFDLCDSATTFQATAFAHTLDGRLGAGVQLLESRLPFTLQPATPTEVTASDKIDVPLSVANNTPERRDVQLTLRTHDNLKLLEGKENDQFAVEAGKTARPVYRFQPTVQEGEAVLEFAGKADPFAADAVRARFRVAPEGFPVAESHSDVLEGSASQTVTLPDTWVKGTLKCRVQVFPSTLADLQAGLDSLLREPNGCFEQTSTSNYPNLLILDYLKESSQTKPEVERRARDLLARGYQKLTSFECTNAAKNAREGYEWFGGTAPAHEALTAYGLLQFRDMARVQDVDPAMLKRTQDYLMSRRDGKGGFLRNPRALDSFGRAPDDVTNAYIVWALTESGKDDDLTKELNALAEQAKASKDPYFVSLVANSLINRARTDEATTLLQAVGAAQKEDGHLDAEKTSITGSGGRDLEIETTALAVLGWLKANPGAFNGNLQKAVKWIGQQRGGYGGFGSTQSTILALKALIAYTKANKRTAEGGELHLYIGDKEAARTTFQAGASEALTLDLPNAEGVLRPGRNDVRVEITGKNVFPYTLSWTYQTLKPAGADDCPVRLETRLSQTEVQEGDLVRLNVTLENVSGKGQGMATAVLGLPGGLGVPEDMKQLKQYTRQPEDGSRPLVSAFEIRGRELVLYWRDLAPGQKISVPLDLIARVPGEYSGPASRAYLYYNADHKHWVDPLRLMIAAKGE